MITEKLVKDVTLVAIAGARSCVYGHLMAILHSTRHIPFENIKLFIPDDCDVILPGIDIIKIPPMDWNGYNEFCIQSLVDYIDTDFFLVIQDDGFILNAKVWNDEFFNYDYIGSVWDDNVMGNGGFSLRSRKLYKHMQDIYNRDYLNKKLSHTYHQSNHILVEVLVADDAVPFPPEDVLVCRHHRREIESAGFNFATHEMAWLFSTETRQYSRDCLPFGYHGKPNARYYKPNDDLYDYMTKDFAFSAIRRAAIAGKDLLESYQKYCGHDGYGDTGTAHSYLDVYNKIFHEHKTKDISLLEIGGFRGHSLMMWADFFEDSEIIGIDVQDFLEFADDTFAFHICDGTSKSELEGCLGDKTFDYIIDDGSHQIIDQVKSFQFLFERIRPGGAYIIQAIQNLDDDRDLLVTLHDNVEIYDLRPMKNRWDDVLVVVKKQ